MNQILPILGAALGVCFVLSLILFAAVYVCRHGLRKPASATASDVLSSPAP